MEQAVGDQCPLKSLMFGPQWREHAVICQAVAHVPPLGQKVVETVPRPQHGLDKLSAERLTDHTGWAVQTAPAPLCMIDLGRWSSRPVTECSPACLTAVPSVSCAMPGWHTRWAASPLLWTPRACSEAASLSASAESGNTTAGLPCCVPRPHARPKLNLRCWWRQVAWWSGRVRCLFPGW